MSQQFTFISTLSIIQLTNIEMEPRDILVRSNFVSLRNATQIPGSSIQPACQVTALCLATDHPLARYLNPEENLHNYWLQNSAVHAYKTSKFRAYENLTDLPVAILEEYETVRQALVERLIGETERMDVVSLQNTETGAIGNNSVDLIVKKYFYFKSKYYHEINKWYYDIVFNMRKFFKDKHKYGPAPFLRRSVVETYRILDEERNTDALFNNLGVRLRDKISARMKSLRIRFYYALNQMMSARKMNNLACLNVPKFGDVIRFATTDGTEQDV